uniref:F-box domain-containing protein n=2 Tax=Aegilops tauschii TaxID=37682 RepID=A0A453QWM3_AEGTS
MGPERIDVYRDFPADVLANILARFPPNTRRTLRLVCRHWAHVVAKRTATNLRSRAKILVVTLGSAYVVDNPSAPGKPRELWTGAATARRYNAMSVVGTCNGLVCLYDDQVPGGAITVANRVTDEALSVPRLPTPQPADGSTSWHEAYSFTYLPATGRYKVVHVGLHAFDAVHVFTLGKPRWRAVPVGHPPRFRRDGLGHKVVTVDGAAYWATSEGTYKVMSFDAEHERVTPIPSLPPLLSFSEDKGSWHIAEVRGRLAVIFNYISLAKDMTEVWVMEGKPTARQIRWSRWYVVRISMPHHWLREPRAKPRRLTWPLFVHGEDILTWEWSQYGRAFVLYRHTPVQDTRRAKHGVVDISEKNRGAVVATINRLSYHDDRRTFAYVETQEPLSVYMSAAI